MTHSVGGPTGSLKAMTAEAARQGWMEGTQLNMVPELADMYSQSTSHFMQLFPGEDLDMLQPLVYHCTRYLFAKGVEGAILWGLSPDGKISIYIDPKHLTDTFQTEVPSHLHQTVVDSMAVGDSLYEAHRRFVQRAREAGRDVDLRAEIAETLTWAPRFGMHYGLARGLHDLQQSGSRAIPTAAPPVVRVKPTRDDYIACAQLARRSGEAVSMSQLDELLQQETEPDTNGYLCELGVWFWKQGLYLMAASCYARSIYLKPEAPTLFNLAACLDDMAEQFSGDEKEATKAQAAEALRRFYGLAGSELERESANAMLRKQGKNDLIKAAKHNARRPKKEAVKPEDARLDELVEALSSMSPGEVHIEAIRLAANGDLQAAIVAFGEAIELLPEGADKASAYYNRGYSRAHVGDIDGALADYAEAIRTSPSKDFAANAHYFRACAYALAGNLEAACEALGTAIDLDPSWRRKARAEFEFRSIATNPRFQALISDPPTSPQSTPPLRAATTRADSRSTSAPTTPTDGGAPREAAAGGGPLTADEYFRLGQQRAAQGDLSGAIADYTEAIRLFPPGTQQAWAYFGRGLARAEAKDWAGAIDDHTQAIGTHPSPSDRAIALVNRANARDQVGDQDGALADYGEAIRLAPSPEMRAMAHYNRGTVQAANSQWLSAALDFDAASRLYPDGAEKHQAIRARDSADAAAAAVRSAAAEFPLHYAHWDMPARVLDHPQEFYRAVFSRDGQQYLLRTWQLLAAERGIRLPQVSPRLTTQISPSGAELAIIDMPPSDASPTVFYIVVAFRTKERLLRTEVVSVLYFTLMLVQRPTSGREYIFCETRGKSPWFDLIKLFPLPDASLQTFLSNVEMWLSL